MVLICWQTVAPSVPLLPRNRSVIDAMGGVKERTLRPHLSRSVRQCLSTRLQGTGGPSRAAGGALRIAQVRRRWPVPLGGGGRGAANVLPDQGGPCRCRLGGGVLASRGAATLADPH